MKKAPIVALGIILGLVILVKAGIFDSLMLFILAGVIPGTTYAIPSTFMLLLIMSIAWLLFFNLVPIDTLRSSKTAKKKTTAKKRLPKQRYKQI
jgi:hypothetical protein